MGVGAFESTRRPGSFLAVLENSSENLKVYTATAKVWVMTTR